MKPWQTRGADKMGDLVLLPTKRKKGKSIIRIDVQHVEEDGSCVVSVSCVGQTWEETVPVGEDVRAFVNKMKADPRLEGCQWAIYWP